MNILANKIVKARFASYYNYHYHFMAYLLLRPNRFFYTLHLPSEQVEGLITFFLIYLRIYFRLIKLVSKYQT